MLLQHPAQKLPPRRPAIRRESGSVKGKGDNSSFSFHHHECDDGTEKRENLSDHGVGVNFQFHAGHERDFDGVTVLVAADSILVTPDAFSINLSDGYTASGNLLSGCVTIQ